MSILDQFDHILGHPCGEYGCEEVVPRGYLSLMDLYENNYIRFKKLVDDIGAIDSAGLSHVTGCQSVHLKVIERSRYTTTVRMTYFFHDDENATTDTVAEPDLKLRIYHDAGLIEVVAGHLRHGRQRLDRFPASALRSKWRLNRFLYKWLGYCLYLGHSIKPEATFLPDESAR